MRSKYFVTLAAIAIATTCAGARAGDVVTDASYGAFDHSSGTRTLAVTSHGLISDVGIGITFSKCDDPVIGPNGTNCIGHGDAFSSEIVFQLTNPAGRTVSLVDASTYIRGPGSGRVQVIFDDQASTMVGGIVSSGTFRPRGLLSGFNGDDMYGNWTLTIRDTTGLDPLEYFSSQLAFNGASISPVPEPATGVMLGVGLLGVFAARRRNQCS
jgi:hypothetical protein